MNMYMLCVIGSGMSIVVTQPETNLDNIWCYKKSRRQTLVENMEERQGAGSVSRALALQV